MEVQRVVAQPAALPELVELDPLDLDGREPLAEHDVAAEEALAGPRVLVVALRRPYCGELLFRLRTSGDDPDAAGEQPHRGPRLRSLGDIVAQLQLAHGLTRNRIPFAVVMVGDLFPQLDRLPVLGVLGDGQQLGMAGQVVRGRDDDLIACLPVDRGVDDQRGLVASVSGAHRLVQSDPALAGRPGDCRTPTRTSPSCRGAGACRHVTRRAPCSRSTRSGRPSSWKSGWYA